MRARVRDAGAGDVWAGRVVATGVECTVRRVRLPPGTAGRETAMRSARLLVELDHPHLVPVIDVIATSEGIAVVSEPVDGAVNLGRLLGVRERLEPGEVVTVGLPLAQALAAAHAAGVVHGRLDLADVLLEPNGRPMLAGTGVAGLGGPPTTPPVDVGDLAGLLLAAMPHATGPAAAAVAVAVAPALVDDPDRRPTAGELAAALARSCNPAPVRMLGRKWREDVLSAPPPVPPPPTPPPLTPPPLTPPPTVLPAAGGGSAGPAGEVVTALPLPALPPSLDATSGPGSTGRIRLAPSAGPRPARFPRASRASRASRTSRTSESARPSRRAAADAPGAARNAPARVGVASTAVVPTVGAPGAAVPGAGGSEVVTARAASSRTGGVPTGRARVGGVRPGSARTGRRPAVARGGRSAGLVGGHALFGSRRRVLLVVAAFIVFVCLPVGGLLVTAHSNGLVGPAAQVAPGQAWRDVLVSLTDARSRAFERADEVALLDADALDSLIYSRDLALTRQIVASGGRPSGMRHEIADLDVRENGSEKAVLRVTYRIPPYSYVDAAGTVLAQQPGRDWRPSDVTVVKTDKGWRLASWADTAG
ncbi:hypothetical protein BL254_03670 [Protofrankia sp. BMG5.30]|nr:hypothetical protein BL254_03670 [Protofrankia sp. BMG5.30]